MVVFSGVPRLPKVADSPSPKDTESHPVDEKAGMWSSSGAATEHSPILSEQELSELSFTELRDVLISVDPLNREHILNINKVEAQYWKLNEGYRTGYSDEILGFDCGGQQWVSEVSFPVGTLKKPNMKDITYMEEVMRLIKTEGIPAPSPIEQRWTASSRSPMSPASSTSPDTLYSWVSIAFHHLASVVDFIMLIVDILVAVVFVGRCFVPCSQAFHMQTKGLDGASSWSSFYFEIYLTVVIHFAIMSLLLQLVFLALAELCPHSIQP